MTHHKHRKRRERATDEAAARDPFAITRDQHRAALAVAHRITLDGSVVLPADPSSYLTHRQAPTGRTGRAG